MSTADLQQLSRPLRDVLFLCTNVDVQISYMISAWARMCKIMGKDFEQYLPLVMGPVLKAAALKPEVALLDSMCHHLSSCKR